MKKSCRIPRKTPLRSHTPIRARNPKRKAKAFARAYESEAFVLFVQSLPCIVRGCPRKSECAHLVKVDGGAGLKGRASGCGPMCPFHHRDPVHGLHKLGPRTFESLHRIDLAACAEATARAWRAQEDAA